MIDNFTDHKGKKEFLIVGVLMMLIFIVFLSPLRRGLPTGGDSIHHLGTANWIVKHETIPGQYQWLDYGQYVYPQFYVPVLLSIFGLIAGNSDIFGLLHPIYEIFQVIMLMMLVVSYYLLGSLFNKKVAFWSVIGIMGSYSIIRIYIGAGMPNLIGMMLVNFLLYFISLYIRSKEMNYRYLVLILLLLLNLYIVHKYFTFPLFVAIFLATAFFCNIEDLLKNRKKYWVKVLSVIKKYKLSCFLALAALILLLSYLFEIYWPMYIEIRSAINAVSADPFRQSVPLSNYDDYIGKYIFWCGFLTLLMVIIRSIIKKKMPDFLIMFIILWVAFCFIVSFMNYLGFYFYVERFIFQFGFMFILLAGIFIETFLRWIKNKYLYAFFALGLLLLFTLNGLNDVRALYESSSWWTEEQINVYKYLNSITQDGEKIITNLNTMSPGYDYYFVPERQLYRGELQNYANDDKADKLISYLDKEKIKYVIFTNLDRIGESNPVLKFLNNRIYFDKIYDKQGNYIFTYRGIK